MKTEALKTIIGKEELYQLYIIENLSGEEIANKLKNINKRQVYRLLKLYNIIKPKELRYKAATASRTNTNLKKYGTTCSLQAPEIQNKVRQTWINKYGVDSPNKSEIIKQKKKLTTLTHYGVENPSQAEEIKTKKQLRSLEKYGTQYTFQAEEVKQKIVNTVQSRYGVDNYAQTADCAKKIASTRHTKSIAQDGTLLDSSWEVLVYDYCLRNNIPIERLVPVTYEYLGKTHTTLIDFKIDGLLFEVKGNHLLSGCFDYTVNVPIEQKLDVYKQNHVILISKRDDIFGKPNSTESNGLKYSNKCSNPLIGVDINLFDNPDFPYDDTKPKCFYDVRVDNKRSSFEAFQDEKLRWEMIKNRIYYSGGFIDSKQILTAMNVTRMCKQPSWFSEKFAKYIIEKYCTSNVIVDSFAGWGTRADACVKLNRQYIGCDLNPELVEWHKKHNRNISFDDATSFVYDGECSVFICPPYTNIETYFENQNVINTQCQWLQIVMNNVPNAHEYVMVCKKVDPGWEKYIVETKQNRSHFGVNKEYILVIKNEEKEK